MQNIIIIVNVITAISLIGIILLQQGKGAEMGASFGGGASQTVFGSQGSGSFFTKLTALLALVFFTTSVTLAIMAKNNAAELAPAAAIEKVDGLAEEPVATEPSATAEPSATTEPSASTEPSAVAEQGEGLAEEAEGLSEDVNGTVEELEGLADEAESIVDQAEGLAEPDQ